LAASKLKTEVHRCTLKIAYRMYRLHLSYRQQPTGPWGAQANTLSLLSLASRERRYVPLSEPEPIAPAEALPDLETEDRRSLRHSLHTDEERWLLLSVS